MAFQYAKRENPSTHGFEVRDLPANASDYAHGLTGVNQPGNFLFANTLIAFFLCLLGITLILRIWKLGHNHLRHLFATGNGRDKQAYWRNNHTDWWPWIKRHILYAPLWRNRHNREIRISKAVNVGTLPSRLHTVLLLTYLAMNIAYCCILDYSQSGAAISAELRGRSGALAVINLIPTVVFALRNNPFIAILQVSYDTFNLLHRWCARIVILETIAHVLAWALLVGDTSGFKGIVSGLGKSMFMEVGVAAAAFGILLAITSWSPLRHAFYETFLNIHRFLTVATIVTIYMHLNIASLPQLPWVKLVIAIYAFELLCRIIRLVYHNWTRQRGFTSVTIEALPAEACRVTFHLARPWRFRPGANVHTYFPRFSWLSSHPFSVAWAEDHIRVSLDPKDVEKAFPMNNSLTPTTDLDLDRYSSIRTDLSLICRAQTGMTRKMYDAASKAPNRTLTTSGCVEGPYGGHESLDSYGTVVLFAGGVGITHQLPYIRHLVESAAAGTVAARKVVLVWSVQNTEALEWVRPWMDTILKLPGRRDVLKVMLFVTKPKSRTEVVSSTGTVQMYPGRCNPQTIVDKEVLDRVGSMCVTVCSPGSFADSVRAAVRKRTQIAAVDFIEQAFTY